MSPRLLGLTEEKSESNVTLLASSASTDRLCQNNSELKERNYMGLSESSSGDSSDISIVSDESKIDLNVKATELRLGLPGSQSPERDPKPPPMLLNSAQLDEKRLFPLHPVSDHSQKNVAGNKRGFSDAMEGKFLSNSANLGLKPGSVLENLVGQSNKGKEATGQKTVQDEPCGLIYNDAANNNNTNAPAGKTQVVGWPPIRSFRKNSLVSTSKNADEIGSTAGAGALFVKVSMDGAPCLRKVDLKNYTIYQELSSALEKLFSCFTIGQCGSQRCLGSETVSNLKDPLHGSECVLTYEDKDGDWMLVGDVPWEMFIHSCKRLRIMKSSDAIGLAPRATKQCRNRN